MSLSPLTPFFDIDLPAQPGMVMRMALLLAEDDVDLKAVAHVIESDMALGAAVLKAVNSPLYGLSGRVQSVQQAITYLGTREVAAVTYEMGLRAVFSQAPELEPIWTRAALRGVLMGRMGHLLNVDPWGAHSAGLFEECGKAVLFRHSPRRYLPLLYQAQSDTELVQLEIAEFGIGHDALGASLCEHWGLNAAVIASVSHHVRVQACGEIPLDVPRRSLCALSALAHVLMTAPEALEESVVQVAPQALLDETLVLRGARRVAEQLEPQLLRRQAA